MASKTSLRAVQPGESPPKPARPMTVTEAVERGTIRDQFVAMRARIATAIDDPNIRGADLAALTRRLHELGREVILLDAAGEEQDSGPIPDEAFDASAI